MQSKIERYTPSDVGVVPADWSTPLLSEVSTLITNGFVGTASPYYVDEHEGIPYFFGKNVRANKLDPIGIRYITPEFHEKQSKTALKTGDLLTVQSGHIGETAVVTEEYDNTNCHALIVTRLKQDLISPIFLSYYINSEIGKARLKGLEVGSTILHINTKDLKKFRIIQPSLPEQQKIAKILTTWDKAIDTTARLIDNSKQQKKALMQQLLTGKQRFDFEKNSYELKQTRYGDIPKDWKYVKIKDIAKQLTKKNSDNNDYPVISCSKHYGFVNSLDYFKKQVFSDNTTGYRIIPRDCFGFPANHIEEGSIGLQTTHNFALVSPIYVVFEANQQLVNNIYLYALLKTEHYRQIFSASTNASVDRRGSLRWKEFSEIRIPLPPLKEQQKIAAVLTNADKEIELLEQQLADLQQEKKALMQVLLTGKKRVVVDEIV